jgi:hypothetical protein
VGDGECGGWWPPVGYAVGLGGGVAGVWVWGGAGEEGWGGFDGAASRAGILDVFSRMHVLMRYEIRGGCAALHTRLNWAWGLRPGAVDWRYLPGIAIRQ